MHSGMRVFIIGLSSMLALPLAAQEIQSLQPASHGAKLERSGDRPAIGHHVTGEFRYYFDTAEEFDRAYGFELRYQGWSTDHLGYSLSLGYEKWDGSDVPEDSSAPGGVDLDLVPLGVSALLSPGATGPVLFNADAGLYYAFVNGSVDVDNAVLGRVGINTDVALGSAAGLFLGLGYQFDIVAPEIAETGEDLSAEGLYGRLGLRFNY